MSIVRNLVTAVAVIIVAFVAHAAYLDLFGYKASKIEAELCGGYRLRYQESDGWVDLLQCSRTKVGGNFPKWLTQYAVNPDEKFTLDGMDEVCRPGTKPRDMGGKLACMPYK